MIGVIGGTGLYTIEGLKGARDVSLRTPFGEPSAKLTLGSLEGKQVVFLPRHGVGHCIPPSKINYRANIYAMKKLGVERIISIAACGSLKQGIKPLDFVLVDQFVDRTSGSRQMTFFDEGIAAHIEFSRPVCEHLCKVIFRAGKECSVNIHKGGTYINIEGPAFSTRAESNLYRSWGLDIIGMTNLAEAKLAREAEICYATLACVTDYDCWHESHASVSVEMILGYLRKNTENSKKILKKAISLLEQERACSCGSALKYAIATDPKKIAPEAKRRLGILINKYI